MQDREEMAAFASCMEWGKVKTLLAGEWRCCRHGKALTNLCHTL
jgi:hypothetical protein